MGDGVSLTQVAEHGTLVGPVMGGAPQVGTANDRHLEGDLATAEPETLRYRILHTAARIVRGQRKRKIKIPETWPWADSLAEAFHAAFALTPT